MSDFFAEICHQVQAKREIPFRPTLEDNDDVVVGDVMRMMMRHCWEENPEYRPSFTNIITEMKKTTRYEVLPKFEYMHFLNGTSVTNTVSCGFRRQNLFDRMLTRLEQYSTTLEDKVEERTIQYKSEKERADNLLYQMLPKPVAEMLKSRRVRKYKFMIHNTRLIL